MPIGPLVPGQPTTVTPDPAPSYYSSAQGPAVDDLIIADHVLAVIQMVLNVQQMSLGNIGSPAAVMQAVTNAVIGTASGRFHVQGAGWYVYSATTRTDNGPWYYSAPGMSNVGSWESEFWRTLMNDNNRKFIDSILPYWQTIQSVIVNTPDRINYSIVNQGSNWVVIPDVSANDATYEVVAPVAFQRFELNVTPLLVSCSSGDAVSLRIHISQNGVDYYYTLPPCANTFATELSWPQLVYESTGAQNITITLEGTNTNGHTSTIRSSDLVQWGPTDVHTWLTLKQLQVF